MTGSTERAADAERLAEIDILIAERSAYGRAQFIDATMDLRAMVAALQQDRDAYKGASRDCHDSLGRCAVERDTALRDADESRAEVGRLQDQLVGERVAGFRFAEHELTYHARKDSTGDEAKEAFHIAANWLHERAAALGASPGGDTKALRHPLTGDTATHTATEAQREKNQQWAKSAVDLYEEITRTGRILETRPAASGEDVETQAMHIANRIFICTRDVDTRKNIAIEVATALTAARLSGRAEMREIDEPVIEAAKRFLATFGPADEHLYGHYAARKVLRNTLATRDAALKALIERFGGSAGHALAAIRTLSEDRG